MSDTQSTSTTHFGYQQIAEDEKAARVRGVFDSVASRYDVMNDLMSGGLHRVWKAFTIALSGVRPGQRVLDVAAGTGDLSRAFARNVGPTGLVVMSDINGSMLRAGRDRLIDSGVLVPTLLCDAEKLPFPDAQFDLVSVAFGLRNMTHKDAALREMQRVIKPGGKLLVLEFSKPWAPLRGAYDLYSFQVLPRLGKMVAGDPQSYQYLAESIRMHPDQETLAGMMREAGFGHVDWHNLTAGVVALHIGQKF